MQLNQSAVRSARPCSCICLAVVRCLLLRHMHFERMSAALNIKHGRQVKTEVKTNHCGLHVEGSAFIVCTGTQVA